MRGGSGARRIGSSHGCGGCGVCIACRRSCPTGPTGPQGPTGPTGPGGSSSTHSAFAELAVDAATSSAVFSPLLAVNLNVTTGQLEMLATATADVTPASGGAVTFRLSVDGTPVPNGGASFEVLLGGGATVIDTISLLKRLVVPNGVHTVVLEWATAVGTTATCKPASSPTFYHASLVAREV